VKHCDSSKILLRPFPIPMANWKWVSIYWNYWSGGIESELEEREDEEVQHVESLAHMEKVVTFGMFWLTAWIFIFLIIWTQLFQCKYFYFIFFYQNSWFFSPQIETWIIWFWHRKKKTKFFVLLILF